MLFATVVRLGVVTASLGPGLSHYPSERNGASALDQNFSAGEQDTSRLTLCEEFQRILDDPTPTPQKELTLVPFTSKQKALWDKECSRNLVDCIQTNINSRARYAFMNFILRSLNFKKVNMALLGVKPKTLESFGAVVALSGGYQALTDDWIPALVGSTVYKAISANNVTPILTSVHINALISSVEVAMETALRGEVEEWFKGRTNEEIAHFHRVCITHNVPVSESLVHIMHFNYPVLDIVLNGRKLPFNKAMESLISNILANQAMDISINAKTAYDAGYYNIYFMLKITIIEHESQKINAPASKENYKEAVELALRHPKAGLKYAQINAICKLLSDMGFEKLTYGMIVNYMEESMGVFDFLCGLKMAWAYNQERICNNVNLTSETSDEEYLSYVLITASLTKVPRDDLRLLKVVWEYRKARVIDVFKLEQQVLSLDYKLSDIYPHYEKIIVPELEAASSSRTAP